MTRGERCQAARIALKVQDNQLFEAFGNGLPMTQIEELFGTHISLDSVEEMRTTAAASKLGRMMYDFPRVRR